MCRTAYVRNTVVIATYVVIHRCVLRVWEGGDVLLDQNHPSPIDEIYTYIDKVYTNMLGFHTGGCYIYNVNEKRR